MLENMHCQKKQSSNGSICCDKDFYSHSNWVELGNDIPYGALINSEQPLDILAGQTFVSSVQRT